MGDIDPALIERVRHGDLRIELVGVDKPIALDAMTSLQKEFARIRHPDQPHQQFLSYLSPLRETADSVWFSADAVDLDVFSRVAEQLVAAMRAVMPHVDGGLLRPTDNRPQQFALDVPEWPIPHDAHAPASVSRRGDGDKPGWATLSCVVPYPRTDAVRSYRAQLSEAGFDLADAEAHGSTRGEFVGFRASRGDVAAFVVLTEIASSTYISMNFDA